MKNNSLLWGVGLLLLGGLMLANAMGIRLPNGNSLTSIFWPLTLILLGVWALVSVFWKRDVQTESASIALEGASESKIKIHHGAGELKVHSGASANELLHGTFTGGMEHSAERSGNKLNVTLRSGRNFFDFPFFTSHIEYNWDVALNQTIPTSLRFNIGANKSVIALRDMNLIDLKIKAGANDIDLILPERGRFRTDLDLGAASLTLTIPEGVSARIRASLGVADLNIDKNRFPKVSGVYQSPDYETATNAVDIYINAGAASIKIK
ncbi:MAG: hypothetical protein KF758_16250 [Anaerolineales bacterium]|nr:hypothetical protein [Anaerolineales bacterium]